MFFFCKYYPASQRRNLPIVRGNVFRSVEPADRGRAEGRVREARPRGGHEAHAHVLRVRFRAAPREARPERGQEPQDGIVFCLLLYLQDALKGQFPAVSRPVF